MTLMALRRAAVRAVSGAAAQSRAHGAPATPVLAPAAAWGAGAVALRRQLPAVKAGTPTRYMSSESTQEVHGNAGTLPSNIKHLAKVLPIMAFNVFEDEVSITVLPQHLEMTLRFLRDHTWYQCTVLTQIAGVDYIQRDNRFSIAYELLSQKFNARLRVKVSTDEVTPIPSVVSIFDAATWWEREIYDLLGVFFTNQPDLRRIMTDYGFEQHPLRKDFPLTGYVELRYDDSQKRVVCELIEMAQEYRMFDFSTPWAAAASRKLQA